MEQLKHECGVAMVRLLKPLEYYHQKYGTWMYGLNKLYLLMEKQHNRGQEGAGLACVKLEASPGEEYYPGYDKGFQYCCRCCSAWHVHTAGYSRL